MTGIESIAAERQRQIEQEGWTPEHDDGHDLFELARAGACYALVAAGYPPGHEIIQRLWPFEGAWLKPSDTRRRDLVKGGALILADIERLDRTEARKTGAFGLYADDFELMEKPNGNG